MGKIRRTSQASRALSLELFDASSNNVIPAQAGIQTSFRQKPETTYKNTGFRIKYGMTKER